MEKILERYFLLNIESGQFSVDLGSFLSGDKNTKWIEIFDDINEEFVFIPQNHLF